MVNANNRYYYEIKKDDKWSFGFLEAISDSEAIERLANEEIGYLTRLGKHSNEEDFDIIDNIPEPHWCSRIDDELEPYNKED